MKKLFLPILAAAIFTVGVDKAQAQAPYKTAIGLAFDMGTGPTLWGPQIKHAFNGNNAGNAQVLFGDNHTVIGVDYSYNRPVPNAQGLNWFVGIGPQLAFVDQGPKDKTYFAIRPAAGLEYKISTLPLGVHFDWKPWWNLTNDSNFKGGRFSLGLKYVLN